MSRSQNQFLMLGTNIYIGYRFFGWALSLYSVLFKSKLNSAKMQQNWLHGFRSRNCWGWIKGALVVFAFATMLGSYLSTSNIFLGSVNVNNGNVTTGVFY